MPDDRPALFPGPPPSPSDRVDTGLHFYRDARRVAVLTFVADPFYTIWWLWHLFTFAQREKFPRARPFWWIFVPIYGLVILYQQLDDLKKTASALAVARAFSPALVLALIVLANLVGRFYERSHAPALEITAYVTGSAFAAAATFLTQRVANAYLLNKYSDAQPRGFTTGEIIATVLGLVVLGFGIVAVFVSPSG